MAKKMTRVEKELAAAAEREASRVKDLRRELAWLQAATVVVEDDWWGDDGTAETKQMRSLAYELREVLRDRERVASECESLAESLQRDAARLRAGSSLWGSGPLGGSALDLQAKAAVVQHRAETLRRRAEETRLLLPELHGHDAAAMRAAVAQAKTVRVWQVPEGQSLDGVLRGGTWVAEVADLTEMHTTAVGQSAVDCASESEALRKALEHVRKVLYGRVEVK